MNDFTVIPSADINMLSERLEYLTDKIRVMNNAVDNEMPSEALLELRRTKQTIDGWKNDR